MLKQKLNNIIAISVGILPIYIILIWYRLTHEEVFTLSDMLVFPLIFGGGNILLILALNKYLLKQNINDLNPGTSKWYWDILIGIVLSVVYFILMFVERVTIARLLPQGPAPSPEVIDLMIGLANNPILLAVWLGPVVWIGVAMFEEISRVFFLNCLWQLSKNKTWELIAVIFVALFMGFTHLYQGPLGIISVSIQGLIMGTYYYKFKRIWPLIISHSLYDSLQVIIFVIQVS